MPDLTLIENYLRKQLPDEKKQASLGYLAEQFPYYPVLHWLRVANQPHDSVLKQKAALYANDTFRLHIWLNGKEEMPDSEINFQKKHPSSIDSFVESIETNGVISKTIEEKPSIAEKTDLLEAIPQITKDGSNALPADRNENIQLKPFVFSPDLVKETPKADFIFEPFHTVDYFASQGIKVEKGSDTPLDRQVKSFTEWLKSMKKLSYQPAASYNDPLVERQARSSLADGDVVTEAMAEVWAKQGQMDKAESVFTKLKLLHPEKSHYFAARLKDIKENS